MSYNDPSQPIDQFVPLEYGASSSLPDVVLMQPAPVTEYIPVVRSPALLPQASWQPPVQAQPPRRSRVRFIGLVALICVLAAIFGTGLFSGWTFARSQASLEKGSSAGSKSASQSTVSSSVTTAQESALARAMPAVVEIQGTLSQGESIGSGVIIDTQGDIITNNHVINGTTSLQVVLNNGNTESARVIGVSAANDLAIIRIQPFAAMTVLPIADSSQLTIGQDVLAIGNPLGYNASATEGVISALNRNGQEDSGANLTGLIQTSAAINPGNSGGALINLQGQLVGIPTLSAINPETNTPANGIGFAIPSSQVKQVIAQILGS